MWPLAATFAATLLLCVSLTHPAILLGRKLRILDYPDRERKLHARATPRTGGLAVCLTFVLTIAVRAVSDPAFMADDAHLWRFTTFLVVSTLLLCGVGLWDDKWGMRAGAKLTCQVACILPFVLWGRTTISADLFGWHLSGAWLTVPLVLFWLVSCTNFVNLIDGLDGLAATVALIVTGAVAVLAALHQLTEITWLAVALSGSLAGFLFHNKPPARVFLGDSGSLPLGFLLGALSLAAAAKRTTGLTLVAPLVLLTIPIFDTSMAILRRRLNGRQIGQGDREHIHHCLRDRGLSPTQTLLAIGGMCAATAAAAILGTVLNNHWIALGLCATLLAVLVVGRVFGFNELQLLTRQVLSTIRLLQKAPGDLPPQAPLQIDHPVETNPTELWRRIVNCGKHLGSVEIDLVCEHLSSSRELPCLSWSAGESVSRPGSLWRMSYTAPRGDGLCLRVTASGAAPSADETLHELTTLLYTLCRDWPIDDALRQALCAPDDALSFADDPHILKPHWPAQRHDPNVAARAPLESDAA
ncbi:MAG: glycosyltransferase family 4 protein [Planctomycetaceae bacterium]